MKSIIQIKDKIEELKCKYQDILKAHGHAINTNIKIGWLLGLHYAKSNYKKTKIKGEIKNLEVEKEKYKDKFIGNYQTSCAKIESLEWVLE